MATFIYVEGDANKTPVDLATQPPGTQLVLVTDSGRDIHFIAGVNIVTSPSQQKARFSKGNTDMKNKVNNES